jgi:nitrogen fixation-related uncharacterized protein
MTPETLQAIVPILGVMIPISAVVLGFAVGFWAIYWAYRKQRLQYEERRLMIEKGMTPPAVLPEGEKKRWTPEECLKYGTIMVFLGIGFGVASLLVGPSGRGPHPSELAVAGAIVGLLGLGNLVYYVIARGRKPAAPVGRT